MFTNEHLDLVIIFLQPFFEFLFACHTGTITSRATSVRRPVSPALLVQLGLSETTNHSILLMIVSVKKYIFDPEREREKVEETSKLWFYAVRYFTNTQMHLVSTGPIS